MKVYASYWDNDIRMKSSSGGIFSLMSENVLGKNGIVYGVSMTKDCYGAEFIRITQKKDLEKLRGSKYLQAKLGDTYISVKRDLELGKMVLFSGTGCQVNGLKYFLRKEYNNLFCVDVVCHGVPSPKLWKKYILFRENKIGKIQEVNFRCKKNGWHNYGISENEMFMSKEINPYMQMFLLDVCLRPSCYNCSAKTDKKSDITIADFWGIEGIKPNMDDDKGTSLIIVRTKKGEEIFDYISSELTYQNVTYEEGVRYNPSEYSSVSKPKERDEFFNDLERLSFEELVMKYVSLNKNRVQINLIQRIIKIIKRVLKC